jgi:hypothetical protein
VTTGTAIHPLANGTKRQPWGANPKGIHIFEAGGRYVTLGGNSNRPKFKTASDPTTEELAAATRDYYANFGTWSVNEADKTLTRRYESALRPNNEGTDVKTSVSLAGDELKLSNSTSTAGGTIIETVLRRFLRSRARGQVEARDLERINRASDRLNAEAADVLDYQASDEE